MWVLAPAGRTQALPCVSNPPSAALALLQCIKLLHSPMACLLGGTHSQLTVAQQTSLPVTGDPSIPAHLQSTLPPLQLHLQSLQAGVHLLQRFAQLGQVPGCLVCLGLQAEAAISSHKIPLRGLMQQ